MITISTSSSSANGGRCFCTRRQRSVTGEPRWEGRFERGVDPQGDSGMDFRSHRCLQIGKSICFIDVSYFYSYSFEFLTCMRKRQAKRWKKGEAVFFCCSRSGWRKPILRGCLWTAGAAGTFSCNSTAAPGEALRMSSRAEPGLHRLLLKGLRRFRPPPAKGPHRVAGDTHPQMRRGCPREKRLPGVSAYGRLPRPRRKPPSGREAPLTPPCWPPNKKAAPEDGFPDEGLAFTSFRLP